MWALVHFIISIIELNQNAMLTSQRSSCPMHLHLRHLLPRNLPRLQGLSDDSLLGGAIGGRQAAAAPILVHCTPCQQNQSRQQVCWYCCCWHQDCTAHGLCAHVTICRCIQCFAPAAPTGQLNSAAAGIRIAQPTASARTQPSAEASSVLHLQHKVSVAKAVVEFKHAMVLCMSGFWCDVQKKAWQINAANADMQHLAHQDACLQIAQEQSFDPANM